MIRHRLLRSYRWMRDAIRWRNRRTSFRFTERKAEDRYGDLVELTDKTSRFPERNYETQEIDVSIVFIEGRAAMIWHTADRAFADEFVQNCLNAYQDEFTWIEQPSKPRSIADLFAYDRNLPQNQYWERSDKKAWACLGQTGSDLSNIRFHLDFTTGEWQAVKNVRYGVWNLLGEAA